MKEGAPSSTEGMALYRANGLSAGPPARIMACTLLDMSSTVTTPFLLVIRRSPLCKSSLIIDLGMS